MRRPWQVTVIGCYFLIAGIYLCSIGVILLFPPGVVATVRHAPFVSHLKTASPYFTLAVGLVWSLVGWGLLRLREWARIAVILVLGIGVAWELSISFFKPTHGWQVLAVCLEITVRAAGIWYLLTPMALDVFLQN